MPELLTITEVSRRLGIRAHVCDYAIATAGIIPLRRVGIIRLFSADQLPAIQEAITRTSRTGRQVFSRDGK